MRAGLSNGDYGAAQHKDTKSLVSLSTCTCEEGFLVDLLLLVDAESSGAHVDEE